MPQRLQQPAPKDPELARRYATERRRQLLVLILLATAVLLGSIVAVGIRNVFPPGWWHIDLP